MSLSKKFPKIKPPPPQLTMLSMTLPVHQIGFRKGEIPDRYKSITPERIQEPIVVVLNGNSNDPGFLAVARPNTSGKTIKVILYPDISQNSLCALTFFRATWNRDGAPASIESVQIIKNLVEKSDKWTTDMLITFTGWQRQHVNLIVSIGKRLCPELLQQQLDAVRANRKREVMCMHALGEIIYFPKEWQMRVFKLIANSSARDLKYVLFKKVREHAGITRQKGRRPGHTPENIILPEPDDIERWLGE